MNLREVRKGPFLFILSFVGIIVLVVIGFVIKDVVGLNSTNEKK
jgi:hypothetical protein